ncbi:reverse transcriptase domain-containing protein [Vreelandella zhanjiangensis]|uniref:reverse transcriptase domain-containing protein n=1 Tax=Vreelandella zhanjiangensis TaxID=1121960 RepID=UPI00402A609C
MSKTFNNLYPQIYDFENLLSAYGRARQGKRNRPAIKRFHYNLESNLIDIQNHLIWESWKTGEYRHFTLYEPVYRKGAALPFRDRVMQHSLVAALEPCFGPRMIADTYACIENRGTHKGADKAQSMLREVQRKHGQAYVLKADISKYFYNINHGILRAIVRKRVACKRTLKLIDEIIGSSADPEDINPVGIPLGNLTSQLFANIYLGELDLYVKHALREKYYVRYMDDFCIIHHDKDYLHILREIIENFLWSQLGLKTNQKTQIFPVSLRNGRALDFLGYRIWTTHRRLRKSSIRRMVRKMRSMQKAYAMGSIDLEDIRPVVHSWLAHAEHADTLGLRRQILARFPFMKGEVNRLDEPGAQDFSEYEAQALGQKDPDAHLGL